METRHLSTPAEELRRSVTALADARVERTDLAAEVASLREELAASDIGKRLAKVEEALTLAKACEDTLYATVCAVALTAFDGEEKHPHPAVTITVTTKVLYDPDEAFQYALANLTPALKLDAKVFERIAKDGKVPCATMQTVLKPKIDGDLSAYRTPQDELT
jgi:hypothetical protein